MLTTAFDFLILGTKIEKGSIWIYGIRSTLDLKISPTLQQSAAMFHLCSLSNWDTSHPSTSIIALNCEALICCVFASILLRLKVIMSTPFRLTSRMRSVALSLRSRRSLFIFEPICIDSSFLILQSGIIATSLFQSGSLLK